ncbi:nuclear transport factor 2 family protein [Sphingobium sp. JS3065]|jgi:limonene-1,2-epoxide hydrolase|uniref:limonene-1,2-epoxide hydrolase family protein n=1 Tax=Sphingobium sp. JS3065 TaxID=2970925 RepID=UPI002264C9E8|nr:limonene-1,2-epoxide hydrolase family protein [Sphingobium sp. JS3065]UZW57087.1 nuclear transport factor 2 family protein [Sphingobium sp. JS3065]
MSNIGLIENFIAAWNRLDIPAIESMMAEDIFYHNIPMEPAYGIEGFRKFIAVTPPQKAEWFLHAIAETGNKVLTERTDNFIIGDKPVSIPVMGIFEIEDGKIKQWRDYFDLGQMVSQMEA